MGNGLHSLQIQIAMRGTLMKNLELTFLYELKTLAFRPFLADIMLIINSMSFQIFCSKINNHQCIPKGSTSLPYDYVLTGYWLIVVNF
jgi:hypothetical protein